MPHPRPRRGEGAELDADLLSRARSASDVGRPTVRTVVSTADPAEAAQLRARQVSALVRLLRQAVELRRAA